MNVSFYKTHKVFAYLVFLLLPLWGSAQEIARYQVVGGDTLDVAYTGCGPARPVQVDEAPVNGVYAINGLINSTPVWGPAVVSYIPNPGYYGPDTMTVTHCDQSGGSGSVTTVYLIEVVTGSVTASDDWAATFVDSTVNINVLGNDTGSDSLYVNSIVLENNGSATIQADNTIDFVPQEGFSGLAKVNYVVCVAPDVCDLGTVNIFVELNNTVADTVYIATNKNKSLDLLVQQVNGYQLINSPGYGTVSLVDVGTINYKPYTNFTGVDTLTCAYNTNTNTSLVTFIVDVLDVEGNTGFAKDDYAYSSIGGMVDISVLDNDDGFNLSVSSINVAPANGTYTLDNGVITYLPNPGYTGVEYIRYTACTPSFDCAKADVYIFVGNQFPSPTSYGLNTPINTPLVINYNVPISDWNFILNGGTSSAGGSVVYEPGFYSGTVHGQDISGFNLLIYTPPNGFLGADAFQFQYCVDTDCRTVDIAVNVTSSPNPNIDTFCISDCVWAGDANNDGVANIKDLLPIGYCIGDVGLARPNPTLDWYGQYGDDWPEAIGQNGVNLKHVDTNGDGIISAADTAALGQSYGNYHNLSPQDGSPINNVPLYFITRTPNPGPGDLVEVDIVLGNANFPGVDLYGFTFPLNYNVDNVEPNSLNVRFFDDNWLAYNSPTLSLTNEPVLGRVDVGFTRTNGRAASGYGIVGKMDFIVIDDFDGLRLRDSLRARIRVDTPSAMMGDGTTARLRAEDLWFSIYLDNGEPKDLSDKDLIAYPNPATDQLTLHLNGRNALREVQLFSIVGQQMGAYEADGKRLELDISHLKNGIYVLSVVTDRGYISKKIEVMKPDY
ncbi:MAG: Ig-like domain-containing protein [Bacteroidota bacterium]